MAGRSQNGIYERIVLWRYVSPRGIAVAATSCLGCLVVHFQHATLSGPGMTQAVNHQHVIAACGFGDQFPITARVERWFQFSNVEIGHIAV